MNRKALLTGLLLLALALGGSCILFQKRPWSTASQRTRFMLKMTAELVSPVPNQCIDELHKQLGKHTSVSPEVMDAHFPRTALGINPPRSTHGDAKLILVQDIAKSSSRRCEDALKSCGNCHLPKRNNCRYEIHYGKGKKIHGRVQGRKGNSLLIADFESLPRSIPMADIHKSVWLNGADPLHTWWDFKRFGRKGKTAKRMLEIAVTHGVACTNCHVRHGDFRLTKEGLHFEKTGKVIKRVPLHTFQ